MCTFKSILKLILDSASVVRVVASSNIVLEGDAYTLGCEVTGVPMPTVIWIKVSNNQSTHGNILEFTSIDRNDAGDYKCEASNRCGMEAKTETINVSCKYHIVSIWLLFMRKYFNILNIISRVVLCISKRERLCKKTTANENIEKKRLEDQSLQMCCCEYFFSSFLL